MQEIISLNYTVQQFCQVNSCMRMAKTCNIEFLNKKVTNVPFKAEVNVYKLYI